jgi:hypothetical protein
VWEGCKRDLIPFGNNRLGANSLLAVWKASKAICNWIRILGGTIHHRFTASMQGQQLSLKPRALVIEILSVWRVAGISALLDKGRTANSQYSKYSQYSQYYYSAANFGRGVRRPRREGGWGGRGGWRERGLGGSCNLQVKGSGREGGRLREQRQASLPRGKS